MKTINDINKKLNKHGIPDNIISICTGRVLSKSRKERGFTGYSLAKTLNITQQQVSRYERGVNKLTIDLLFKMSIILDIPFENLIASILLEIKSISSEKNVNFLNQIVSKRYTHFY